MKTFDKFQSDIKAKYTDIKTLPLLTRIKIRLFENPDTFTDSIVDGYEKMSQTYKVYYYNGKIYFYKFGW